MTRRIVRRMSIVALAAFAGLAALAAEAQAPRADHALLIGIDGLGSEGFRRAQPPAMRALVDAGAHTLAARGVIPTVSSPNWASMISGAGPAEHGVTSNDWMPDNHPI